MLAGDLTETVTREPGTEAAGAGGAPPSAASSESPERGDSCLLLQQMFLSLFF